MPPEINLMLPTWIASGGKLYGTLHNEILEFDGATRKELSRVRLGREEENVLGRSA